jgi:hypothetical protein
MRLEKGSDFIKGVSKISNTALFSIRLRTPKSFTQDSYI